MLAASLGRLDALSALLEGQQRGGKSVNPDDEMALRQQVILTLTLTLNPSSEGITPIPKPQPNPNPKPQLLTIKPKP